MNFPFFLFNIHLISIKIMYGTIILKGGGKIENIITCDGYGKNMLNVRTIDGNSQIVYVENIFSILF